MDNKERLENKVPLVDQATEGCQVFPDQEVSQEAEDNQAVEENEDHQDLQVNQDLEVIKV